MKKYRLKKLSWLCSQAMCLASVMVPMASANDAEPTNSKAVDEDVEIIEVKGTRAALIRAMELKRESKNVMDSIIAEDIGKMPDKNIAEALQRITGVSIQSDMGEGTTVNIRGMGGDFNQIKVNGQTLTSGGDGRDVDFSSMSADLLAAIEVVKSPSANHDEGSIGGAINLKTFKPLEIKWHKFKFNYKHQYNDLSGKYDPSLSLSKSANFNNVFGVFASINGEQRQARQDSYFTRGWREVDLSVIEPGQTDEASLANIANDVDGAGWYPDEFGQRLDLQERSRLGGTLNFQLRPTENLDTHLDFTYSQLKKEVTFYQNWNRFRFNPGTYWLYDENNKVYEDTGNYYVDNIRIDPNGTFTAAEFSGKGERSNGAQDQHSKLQSMTRSERRGETTTKTFSVGFGLEYRMEALTVSTELGYSQSREDNDNESQFLFSLYGVTQGYNISDDEQIEITEAGDHYLSRFSNQHALSQIRDNKREIRDDNFQAQIDFDWALDLDFFYSMQFGVKWTDRTKQKIDDSTYIKMWIEDINNSDKVRSSFVDPNNPVAFPVDDFMRGVGSDNMIREWSVIDFDTAIDNATSVFGVNSFDELPFGKYRDHRNTYNLNIETNAAYAMLNFESDSGDFAGDIGVRYVETIRTAKGYAGNQYNLLEYRPGLENYANLPVVDYVDVNVVKKYDNLLPSLNMRYIWDENKLLRLAVAEVMARPNFWEIAPYSKSSPLVAIPSIWQGNPNLDPFEAVQADVSYEWYFDEGAMFSLAAFYKDIDSFFFNRVLNDVTHDEQTGEVIWTDIDGNPTPFRIFQPQNGAGGEIVGVETALQSDFTFLPGWLSNFGVNLNYTYSDSSADYLKLEVDADSPLQGLDLPFLNQSKHSANAIFYYEDKGKFSARLAYSYRSDSLHNPTGPNNNIYWNKGQGKLDFSTNFKLTKTIWGSFQIVNLTDAVKERYVTSALEGNRLEGEGPTNRTLYNAVNGRTFRLGISGSF